MPRSALVLLLACSVAHAQDAAYVAPKGDGPVVDLLEDTIDPFIPLLSNPDGAQPGAAVRSDLDVFAGLSALRVTKIQKYHSHIPGWGYKIVEKPTNPGEFRYLRFAWRKLGGTGIMVQLHEEKQTWSVRYVAGPNTVGWGAKTVAEKAPEAWAIVTRDLFQDFGELKVTGIAFTPMDGDGGLFDHVLLGRTEADLDKVTNAALGRTKPAKPLTDAERLAHWRDLTESDPAKAATALRALLASAAESVPFLRKEAEAKATDEQTRRIDKLIAELDSDEFAVREAASKELTRIGAPTLAALEAAVKTTTSAEVKFRAAAILRELGGRVGATPTAAIRAARAARILEQAHTAEADQLLEEMARGVYGEFYAEGAKLALRRR